MSDTYRRYTAIKRGLMQFYRLVPGSHREQHFNTLAALICGLAGSQRAHLSTIADHAPSNDAKQESTIDRFRRWLKHDRQTIDGWFVPVAKQLLQTLAKEPIQLVMDGSVVGRGCIALMLSVVYHGRALPLCWIVVEGAKGHFPETLHQQLLARVQEIVPEGASVTFLGDGEFDGTALQADLCRAQWHYICRTACSIRLTAYGVSFSVGALGPPRGEVVAVTPAWMTAEQYGPVSILALWEARYQQPIYLVTTLEDLDLAVQLYKLRPHIETFFSDLKSRGFQIHKSHLSAPARLCRLLIACCLAYLWLVYLGVCAIQDEWMKRLHRQDRCDLSLFRLGLRLLARALKEHIRLPKGLLVPAALPKPLIRTFAKHAT
jgi:DDE family transposase